MAKASEDVGGVLIENLTQARIEIGGGHAEPCSKSAEIRCVFIL
jgi:hypothetical protein